MQDIQTPDSAAYTIHMMIAEMLAESSPGVALNAAWFAHGCAVRVRSADGAIAAAVMMEAIMCDLVTLNNANDKGE